MGQFKNHCLKVQCSTHSKIHGLAMLGAIRSLLGGVLWLACDIENQTQSLNHVRKLAITNPVNALCLRFKDENALNI